jgi:putative FmdB family regulatory protein
MPTYEYLCQSCGTRLEVVQGFHDAALTTCEACGGELRKVFSAVGIVFKGSGFYKTDSRSSGAAAKPAAAKKPAESSVGETAPAPAAPSPTASPTGASA